MITPTSLLKKNKIFLSDYSFESDIENRILLAHLSAMEVEFLSEVIHNSLQIPISSLCQAMQLSDAQLQPLIERFACTNLFKAVSGALIVDKERRKYFEIQIGKFDPGFEPNVEYMRSLLRKVPIEALPNWYAIPRSTSDIFGSIIEKYLLTPKIYQRHVSEQTFDDPLVSAIFQAVMDAPRLCATTAHLLEKFAITERKLQECLLLLEFHFMCCSSYRFASGQWQEIVTPFQEWRDYLLFLQDAMPAALPEKDVHTKHADDFGFVQDAQRLLVTVQQGGSLKESGISQEMTEHLLVKMRQLSLIEQDRLQTTSLASEWIALNPQEKALSLYRLPFARFVHQEASQDLFSDRAMREIERCLCRMPPNQWLLTDEFIASVIAPLKPHHEVCLTKKGRNWKYRLPQYTEEEKLFLQSVVEEPFYECGFVRLGTFKGSSCFLLTDFGRKILGI